jgi:hypothetical protein
MKNIVKVEKTGGTFRINIPRRVVRMKCWGDVRFVMIDDNCGDTLVIRRLLDGKMLEDKS